MNKKYVKAGLGMALSIMASASFATGLTLSNKIGSDIKASCHDLKSAQHFNLPMDMKKNSDISLPWVAVAYEFNFSHNVSCSFMLDDGSNKNLGSAELDFNTLFSEAKVTHVNEADSNYKITILPAPNVMTNNLSIKIEQ